jgi:hypothetical protein
MNDDGLQRRVGFVETELARQGERLGRMELDVSKTSSGVDTLLERAAANPPMSFKGVIGTVVSLCALLGMLAAFTYQFIAHSPAVGDLEKRLTKLDDPEIGRVQAVERVLGWRTTTVARRP